MGRAHDCLEIAAQRIVPGAAGRGAGREVDGDAARRATVVNGVDAGAALERVVAQPALDRVVAGAAEQPVVAGRAGQLSLEAEPTIASKSPPNVSLPAPPVAVLLPRSTVTVPAAAL